jgi:hypothetical protein
MRRAALLGTLIALACAAPAAAWIELPPYPIPHDGVADCVRAGGPGQVAVLGGAGRTRSTIDLLTAGPRGLVPGPSTSLGLLADCAEVAFAPGAKPLLVAPTVRSWRATPLVLRAADAGGSPATISRPGHAENPSVAVAPNGAAVVAWSDADPTRPGDAAFAVVRPVAGAPFGAPVRLGPADAFGLPPVAAIDAAGRATVAWDSDSSDPNATTGPTVASTTGGGGFGAPQLLTSDYGGEIALAVSPSDRTLVVTTGDSLLAFERLAGATSFARVKLPSTGQADELAVALADDGGAVIAFRPGLGPPFALLRRPGGTFGRQPLDEARPGGDIASFPGHGPKLPSDINASHVAATLGAGGRVLVTWVDFGDRLRAAAARVARGTLAAGLSRATSLGSPCRAANAARPLPFADGTLGVAWTDDARTADDTPLGGGMVHVVAPGAARSGHARAPRLSAQVIGSHAVHVGQALRVRVRCDGGPCVVRAAATAFPAEKSAQSVLRSFGIVPLSATSAQLAPQRAAVLTLMPARSSYLGAPGRGRTPISLLACTPDGRTITRLTLRARLRQVPLPPLPRVRDLVARRHGERIHVTWRTSIPARGVTFYVAMPSLNLDAFPPKAVPGKGRTRFSATLRVPRKKHPRKISVFTVEPGRTKSPVVTTRVR